MEVKILLGLIHLHSHSNALLLVNGWQRYLPICDGSLGNLIILLVALEGFVYLLCIIMMLKVSPSLQVALSCVSISPLQRPRVHDVLKMISSVRPSLLQTESDSSPSSASFEGGQQQGSQPHATSLDALEDNSNGSASTDPSPYHRSSQHVESSTSMGPSKGRS